MFLILLPTALVLISALVSLPDHHTIAVAQVVHPVALVSAAIAVCEFAPAGLVTFEPATLIFGIFFFPNQSALTMVRVIFEITIVSTSISPGQPAFPILFVLEPHASVDRPISIPKCAHSISLIIFEGSFV